METTTRSREGASLVSLIAGLREDGRNLFREEILLAKTEISEKVSRFSRNGVGLAIGGGGALIGAIFLLLSLAFILAYGIEASSCG
jgi:Putative Actinobacterial Holin-X, holin superfamily III